MRSNAAAAKGSKSRPPPAGLAQGAPKSWFPKANPSSMLRAMLPNTRAPAERTAPPRDLEIRPKQVKAWIEALPHAQSAEAAKKMTAHLAALNRAKVDVDDRVQILETYLPFVATVLEELDAIYGKAALPLSTRAREALNQARGLAFELASGYRIAIMDNSGKLIAFVAKKQLPLLAWR